MQSEMTITVINNSGELDRIASRVAAFCTEHETLAPVEHRLVLVLEELLTNTIDYGYDAADTASHTIEIRLGLHGGTLTVEYSDDARPFDPTCKAPPDLTGDVEDRPVGGLGIHLVMTIMDTVTYAREHDRNTLRMTMALSS